MLIFNSWVLRMHKAHGKCSGPLISVPCNEGAFDLGRFRFFVGYTNENRAKEAKPKKLQFNRT
jgi:hypothetical protein